ncbi:MAG: hypothetical protein ACRD96_05220 [Bryobacteraceae bacterium]
MALAQLVLFGVVTSPEELMDPILRRMDEILDDEGLIDQVVAAFAESTAPRSPTQRR